MVVAAYGDGTIRWHRADDGRELLALKVLANKTAWVLWTPGRIVRGDGGRPGRAKIGNQSRVQ